MSTFIQNDFMIYGHGTFYKSYSRLININKRNTENKQMDRQKYRLKPVRKSSKTVEIVVKNSSDDL